MRFIGILGLAVIIGIAWLLSTNRQRINWKIPLWGLLLQILLAILILRGRTIANVLEPLMPFGSRVGAALIFVLLLAIVIFIARRIENAKGLWLAFSVVAVILALRYNLLEYLFSTVRDIVTQFIAFTASGSEFVFGPLANEDSTGFIFATQVLPTIIFIASVFAVLYYLGVMQVIVRLFAKVMTRYMGASGAESTNVAAAIFMGQTEAPLTIRPYLERLTMSELMTVMVSGMATVSGGIMAAYVMVADVDVLHLLTASIMAAPASILLAKIMVPETEEPETGGEIKVEIPQTDVNIIDAAGRGALEGLHLSLNVAAMLIAFIALIAMINAMFLWAHDGIASAGFETIAAYFPSSFDQLLGWLFRPIAFVMGVPWAETQTVGNLLGIRMVLNEFVAFLRLGEVTLSPRAFIISTYALCGFANFSSIAIQIGGIGALAPNRRGDLARLGVRAMIAGTLANFMTASIAGMLL